MFIRISLTCRLWKFVRWPSFDSNSSINNNGNNNRKWWPEEEHCWCLHSELYCCRTSNLTLLLAEAWSSLTLVLLVVRVGLAIGTKLKPGRKAAARCLSFDPLSTLTLNMVRGETSAPPDQYCCGQLMEQRGCCFEIFEPSEREEIPGKQNIVKAQVAFMNGSNSEWF